MTKEQAGILGSEPHTGGLAIPSTKHKPPKNLADGMIKALRPRQWVKNVLVLAAPMAAGSDVLLNRRTIIDVAIAFAVFCMAASAIYLVNDAKDVEADRAHPTKQFRPIAAGVLPVGLAYGMAVLVLQLGYCFGWKHLPVIDIALVSSGFMLRAMAGGVAAGITLSQWFLLVAAFGSLFMASGKRYAEILLAEKSGAKIRKALEGYTPTYLRFVWTLSATAVVMSYALWGFEMANMVQHHGAVWYQVSMVPFTVAILRYAADVDRGDGGAPDELALSDRTLQILAIAWVGCIAAAVYIAPVVS